MIERKDPDGFAIRLGKLRREERLVFLFVERKHERARARAETKDV